MGVQHHIGIDVSKNHLVRVVGRDKRVIWKVQSKKPTVGIYNAYASGVLFADQLFIWLRAFVPTGGGRAGLVSYKGRSSPLFTINP